MSTVAELFEQAKRFSQAGDTRQAEPLYRQVIEANPSHADAHYFLGLIALQTGHSEAAIALLRQAVALKANVPSYHANLGVALKACGQLAEAAQSYREALRLNPQIADIHYNLGNVLKEQRNLAEASACYRQAIRLKPRFVEALSNLGLALREQGKPAEAAEYCRQALASNPRHFQTLNTLGNAYMDLGQQAQAIDYYRQALRINPNYVNALRNLGIVLFEQGKVTEATACFRQMLALDPNYADAHNNLGNALNSQGQLAEAGLCFREAVRLDPNLVVAYYNLGTILFEEGQLEEAEACFRQGLALDPNQDFAHNNLGNVYLRQGLVAEAESCFKQALRLNAAHFGAQTNLGNIFLGNRQLAEAQECYRQALGSKPDCAGAHFNRGVVLLLEGNYEEGWAEYEWRFQANKFAIRPYAQPRWDGTPLEGKSILIHAEQGFGDTLQFIRYAALAKERGGTVVLECQTELARILRSYPAIDQIVPGADPLPHFDVQLPLLSLPHVLATTLGTVPAPIPYLSADAALTKHWAKELGAAEFKIGIVWQGNPRFAQPDCRAADERRSIPLAQFEPLARIPGVRLFSLQKGYGTEQLAEWQDRLGVVNLGEKLSDFMDTAAIMMNLDLIISADSSPAHLAGALGRPVWTVLPFAGCWRWLLDRSDSPWYPTMRLFRQSRPGDWAEVFKRIAAAVQGCLNAPHF